MSQLAKELLALKGKLSQLREEKEALEAQASNAVIVLRIKADAYIEPTSALEVDAILAAATDLKTFVVRLRETETKIRAIEADLG